MVKFIENNTGGPLTITVTDAANGVVATTQSSTFVAIVRFNPDGSVKSDTINGIVNNFVISGVGSVLLDAGTVVFDAENNILKIGGPHQQLEGDVEGFCSALAGS